MIFLKNVFFSGRQNLIYFGLNWFTSSCCFSLQKNQFFQPSREVPLWGLFSSFSHYIFFPFFFFFFLCFFFSLFLFFTVFFFCLFFCFFFFFFLFNFFFFFIFFLFFFFLFPLFWFLNIWFFSSSIASRFFDNVSYIVFFEPSWVVPLGLSFFFFSFFGCSFKLSFFFIFQISSFFCSFFFIFSIFHSLLSLLSRVIRIWFFGASIASRFLVICEQKNQCFEPSRGSPHWDLFFLHFSGSFSFFFFFFFFFSCFSIISHVSRTTWGWCALCYITTKLGSAQSWGVSLMQQQNRTTSLHELVNSLLELFCEPGRPPSHGKHNWIGKRGWVRVEP